MRLGWEAQLLLRCRHWQRTLRCPVSSYIACSRPTGNSRMLAMRKLPVVICRAHLRLRRRANRHDVLAQPASMKRDVSADRHDTWGGDAMDVDVGSDERGRRGRRSRVVLISRRWDRACERFASDGGYQAQTPWRARISRKTIAQGMPVDPADPVVTAACFFCCRRAMGEAIARHSLRPLRFLRGPSYLQHSGANAKA